MNAQAISQNDTAPVPVIFRKDAANNKIAFIQSTANFQDNTIEVWRQGVGRSTEKMPMDYYKSAKALSHEEELDIANRFAEDYVPRFGIVIRKRIAKDASRHHTSTQNNETPKSANDTLRRSSDKPVFTFNQEEYRMKMQIAIQAAIAAVDAEYSQK